jgi:hypothetical protein
MNLLDKIKLLVWVNSLINKLKTGGNKMGSLLQKLDGVKSVVGLLMVVAYYAAPQFGVAVPDVVLKIGSGIASIGLAHKLEKGAGLLTKGIDIAGKALDVLKKVVDTMSAQEPKA